jgi:hypothetical protein
MATVTQPKSFNHEETQRNVKHPLQLVRSYIRRYIFLEGIALTLLCASLLFWLGLAFDFGMFKFEFEIIHIYGIDWVLEFNDIDSSGISSLGCRIIALTVIVVGLLALGFSKVVLRWLRDFNDRSVALVLERRFPKELGDRLITAVELADPKLSKKYGYSQAMVEKTILEAVEIIKTLPVASVFNWRRLAGLWFLVALSTFGLFLFTMAAFCVGSIFTEKSMLTPYGYAWRFYDVASIWTERNVLMMDSYWPRRAHVEITRFQPSKKVPSDMRVAKDDEDRPELTVRAFEWVIADRKSPHGWRALRWQDLPKFIDAGTLNAVVIQKDFPYWNLDVDELEPNLVAALFGADTYNKSSGEIRAALQQPAIKKKVADRGAQNTLDTWLDWTEWTVDKLGQQRSNLAQRDPAIDQPAFAASTFGLMLSPMGAMQAAEGLFPGRTDHRVESAPVDKVFAKLEELAVSPAMSRTIRKLDVPARVEVNFRGELTGKPGMYDREEGNKYSVPLKPLAGSVRFKFRARGENYFTPPKSITLVPAPTPAALSIDKEEPAYIYHRLFGPDQMPLQKVKHLTKGLALSMTGEANTISVPLGTKLVIHVKTKTDAVGKEADANKADDLNETERKLRAENAVFDKSPMNPEPNADPFPGKIKIDDDRYGFSLVMDNITRNHDFIVEFFDEDNIRGKRRFKVLRTLDGEPYVGNLNVFGYLPRKPRFKAPSFSDKEKDKEAREQPRDQAELTNSYLITPDALIPLECKIADDYGLVKIGFHYKYRKVDFELVSSGGAKKLPSLEIDQTTRRFHVNLVASNFQLWPGNPFAWHAATNYMGWTAATIQRDLQTAQGYKEGFIHSSGFAELLKERAERGEMIHPDALKNPKILTGIRTAKPWEFDFKQDPGFDLQRNLKELKARALDDIGQMHYHLQLAVQATDNNVETGAEYPQEIDALDENGLKTKKVVTLRGNTKKNANGYLSFIVVSENELLSQIALEEEVLNEKLESAKEKVDAGMVSLLEQQSKVQDPKADMESVLNRMNEIRTALGTSGNTLNEAHQAYDNILKEMKANRVDKSRIDKIDSNIIARLEQIVIQDNRIPNSGSLPRAQEAFQKAHQLVEEDANAKRAPDGDLHRQNMLAAHRQMNILSNDIKLLLDAMSEGIVESKLIALIASIEQRQRENTQIIHRWHLKEVEDRLKELIGDPEKKDEKKKDPPKDEKKTGFLHTPQDSSAQLHLGPATAAINPQATIEPIEWRATPRRRSQNTDHGLHGSHVWGKNCDFPPSV